MGPHVTSSSVTFQGAASESSHWRRWREPRGGCLRLKPVAAFIRKEPEVACGRSFLAGQGVLAHSFQAPYGVGFLHLDLFGKASDRPIGILPIGQRLQKLPVGMIDRK